MLAAQGGVAVAREEGALGECATGIHGPDIVLRHPDAESPTEPGRRAGGGRGGVPQGGRVEVGGRTRADDHEHRCAGTSDDERGARLGVERDGREPGAVEVGPEVRGQVTVAGDEHGDDVER